MSCFAKIFVPALGLVVASSALAADLRLYEDAVRAIDEGVPQVGIHKLKSYLGEELAPEERDRALLSLGEAYLQSNQPADALKSLEALTSPCARFLSARALAAMANWQKALATLEGSDASDNETILLKAEVLNGLGRAREAAGLLEGSSGLQANPIAQLRLADFYLALGEDEKCRILLGQISSSTEEQARLKEYAEARLCLAQGQQVRALELFQALKRQRLGSQLHAGAAFGIAQALFQLGQPEAADDELENFISEHPNSPHLDAAFKFLDEFYSHQETPSNTALEKWAADAQGERSIQARFYYSKALLKDQKSELAKKSLLEFVQNHPEHSLTVEAGLLLGDMLEGEEASQVLEAAMRAASTPAIRARVELAMGKVLFRNREYLLAANAFESAAGRSSELWERATFASAMAWLYQGNREKFLNQSQALATKRPGSTLLGDLLLAEGLQQARSGEPAAAGTLETFLKKFPQHPRRAGAMLAMAERLFLADKIDQASRYLQVSNVAGSGAQGSQPSAPASAEPSAEQAAYLAIFMAEKKGDLTQAIKLGGNFLNAYPKSKLRPEVRMKMGQIHYKNEDFASAETEFGLLANENPESALREAALFLAGQSALRSMGTDSIERALDYFDETAKLNGPLRLNAREAQAILQVRLGKEKEALIIYDSILAAGPEPELRASVLCSKANVLMSLGNTDKPMIEQARAVYAELATTADLRPYWRNQALYKMGKALESQDKPTEALAAYYDVLNTHGSQEPEFFWFYKAGFDAAQLLEAQQQWSAAIAIYKKMADGDGPRANEAKARISQLRLEHFLWD